MARKDDIYSLANNYTAFELARMIMDKQDIIDGMSETLKTYREKTNQAAELINMATEKKHGDIRTGKYVNRKNGVEVELVKVFESGTCVIKHNQGGSQISKEEFESKFVKQHDDQADALRYGSYLEVGVHKDLADTVAELRKLGVLTDIEPKAVQLDWKKYQELKAKAAKWDASQWAIKEEIRFVWNGENRHVWLSDADLKCVEQRYKEREQDGR